MRNLALAGAVLLSLVVGVRAAEEEKESRPLGISFKLSTLGVGGDLTLDLGKYFNLRGGVNYGQYDLTVIMNEADVEGKLRWLTVPILLDWHPAAGGFRISAGAVINKNKISLTADPKEPIELDGTDYSIESLEGEITFRDFSPYIGIGTGDAVGADSAVHFTCDFGVMFQGIPDVSAHARSSSEVVQAALDEALQKEVDNLRDDLSWFQYYPVVSLGFSIAF